MASITDLINVLNNNPNLSDLVANFAAPDEVTGAQMPDVAFSNISPHGRGARFRVDKGPAFAICHYYPAREEGGRVVLMASTLPHKDELWKDWFRPGEAVLTYRVGKDFKSVIRQLFFSPNAAGLNYEAHPRWGLDVSDAEMHNYLDVAFAMSGSNNVGTISTDSPISEPLWKAAASEYGVVMNTTARIGGGYVVRARKK